MEEILRALERRLDENPADWDARRELANLLDDEVGDHVAALAQRYMTRHEKHPVATAMLGTDGPRRWVFGAASLVPATSFGRTTHAAALLPDDVHRALLDPFGLTNLTHWRYWDSRKEAEAALALALAALAAGHPQVPPRPKAVDVFYDATCTSWTWRVT